MNECIHWGLKIWIWILVLLKTTHQIILLSVSTFFAIEFVRFNFSNGCPFISWCTCNLATLKMFCKSIDTTGSCHISCALLLTLLWQPLSFVLGVLFHYANSSHCGTQSSTSSSFSENVLQTEQVSNCVVVSEPQLDVPFTLHPLTICLRGGGVEQVGVTTRQRTSLPHSSLSNLVPNFSGHRPWHCAPVFGYHGTTREMERFLMVH